MEERIQEKIGEERMESQHSYNDKLPSQIPTVRLHSQYQMLKAI